AQPARQERARPPVLRRSGPAAARASPGAAGRRAVRGGARRLRAGRILSRLPIRLLLVDSRPEQLDRVRLADVIDGTADVGIHHTLLGEQVLEQLPPGAHVLIMTHDHAEDYALCDAALRLRQPLGSIGLIGSAATWAGFAAQLAAAGHRS